MLRRLYFKHVHHNLHHQVQTNENEVFYHKPKTTTNTTASNEDEYNYNTSNEDEYNTSNEDEYEYDTNQAWSKPDKELTLSAFCNFMMSRN